MVIAYDNAQRRHRAITFLLRVETISEICEELNLVRRNGKTSLIRHRVFPHPRLAVGLRRSDPRGIDNLRQRLSHALM
jgi:hypothetical protein